MYTVQLSVFFVKSILNETNIAKNKIVLQKMLKKIAGIRVDSGPHLQDRSIKLHMEANLQYQGEESE